MKRRDTDQDQPSEIPSRSPKRFRLNSSESKALQKNSVRDGTCASTGTALVMDRQFSPKHIIANSAQNQIASNTDNLSSRFEAANLFSRSDEKRIEDALDAEDMTRLDIFVRRF